MSTGRCAVERHGPPAADQPAARPRCPPPPRHTHAAPPPPLPSRIHAATHPPPPRARRRYALPRGKELFSFCLLDHFVVAGGAGDVVFWDRRAGAAALAVWDDMHMDDVTCVAACPGGGKLLTASQDGLVAVHATAGGLQEDHGFEVRRD